jgi:hypothetical protein
MTQNDAYVSIWFDDNQFYIDAHAHASDIATFWSGNSLCEVIRAILALWRDKRNEN